MVRVSLGCSCARRHVSRCPIWTRCRWPGFRRVVDSSHGGSLDMLDPMVSAPRRLVERSKPMSNGGRDGGVLVVVGQGEQSNGEVGDS